MSTPTNHHGNGDGTDWGRLGQVVAVITALGGWTAVVGGARIWARLHHADITSTQTLAVLPRQLLIVEGFQTLLVPVLVGGAAALFTYYSWPWRTGKDDRREIVEQERADEERRRAAAEARRRGVAAPASHATALGTLTRTTGFYPSRLRRARQAADERRRRSSDQKDRRVREVATAPEVRIPAPLLLLRRLVSEHGSPALVASSAVLAVALSLLTLAIVRVDWRWPIGAVGVGILLALLGTRVPPTWPRTWRRPGGPRAALLLLAVIAPFVGTIVAVGLRVRWPYIIGIVLVTAGAIWLTLGALVGRSPQAIALTLFAAFVFWAGAVSFLRELGARDPRLETAEVKRTNGPAVCGFYLGGAGGDVYIASAGPPPRLVTLVKEEDVALLSFGSAVPVSQSPCPRKQNERPTAARLSLYALDEVVATGDAIDFPIGGYRTAVTYKLQFTATFRSSTGLKKTMTLTRPRTLTTPVNEQRIVHVPIAAQKARSALRDGLPLLVTVDIRAMSQRGETSYASYSLCVIRERRGADEGSVRRAPTQATSATELLPGHVLGGAPVC